MVNNPHHRLTVLYEKIQRVLARMPREAAYRTSTETIIAERQAVVLAVSQAPLLVQLSESAVWDTRTGSSRTLGLGRQEHSD